MPELFQVRLKAARERIGLGQAEVAGRLQLSAGSLAAYEQGYRDVPDKVLERMAELYGVHRAVLRYGMDVVREGAAAETERAVRDAAAQLNALADRIGAPSSIGDADRHTDDVIPGRAKPIVPADAKPAKKKRRQANESRRRPPDR